MIFGFKTSDTEISKMPNEFFSFSSLIGPAVTVYAIQQLVGYISEKKEKKKKRISAAEILLLETERGVEELTKFLALMTEDYIRARLDSEGHAFYFPCDDAMETISLIKDQIMLLPHPLVVTVMRYYRNDRVLNELLRDISKQEFAGLPRERKKDLARYTMDLSKVGKQTGAAANEKLILYIEEEKSNPDLTTKMKAIMKSIVSDLWSGATRIISGKIGKP